MDKQFEKGVYDMIILKVINQEDMYADEITQSIKENSNGYFELRDGFLYPILNKLEEEYLIQNYWDRKEVEKMMPRRYYRITTKGKETLEIRIEEWRNFVKAVEGIVKYTL